jgi:hypothetical protein
MPRLLWTSAAIAVFVATTYFDAVFGSSEACRLGSNERIYGTALCNPVMRAFAWAALTSFAFWLVAGTGTMVLGGLDAIGALAARLRR